MSEKMLKKIESFLEGVSLKSLLISAKQISETYRMAGKRVHPKEEDILAYLVTRMPATYAVLCRVFQEMHRRLPYCTISSLLDVGSGPGTTLWAAEEFFPALKDICSLEKDQHFIAMAKRLFEDRELYDRVHWIQGDMTQSLPEAAFDLIVASYSLGEIGQTDRGALVEKLWEKTKKVLVVIEPGTPKAFEGLRATRKQLLNAGAHLIAPCPHSAECPMPKGDWCHFYARLNRSTFHRKAKGAELNYEDEKFSYLLFSREPALPYESRILRHPRKGKGHVQMTLCTAGEIKDSIVTKKERDLYQLARKSHWGDAI